MARAGKTTRKHSEVYLCLLLIFCCYATAKSQGEYGSTPLAQAPGVPAGSYALSDIDNVNLFNGHVTVRIPLVMINGRGGASTPIVWHQTSPVNWHVRQDVDGYGAPLYYAERSVDGTPDGISPPLGEMYGILATTGSSLCPYGAGYLNSVKSLTRLFFVEPDGTEHEFRDALTGGQAYNTPLCALTGQSRGKIFYSVDGTSMTFIADNNVVDEVLATSPLSNFGVSGYLLMPDGSRYRVGYGSIRDRNGNVLSLGYDANGNSTITDSLNRQYQIAYASASECSAVRPGSGPCQKITMKGYGGASRSIWLLGNSSNGNEIVLPNGQSYHTTYNSYGDLERVDLPSGGSVEYSYGPGNGADGCAYTAVHDCIPGVTNGGIGSGFVVYRRVIERRVYKEGHALVSRQTFDNQVDSSFIEEKFYDADNNLLLTERHYFYGTDFNSFNIWPTDYTAWRDGHEYRTEIYDPNGHLMRRTETSWQQRSRVSWWTGTDDAGPQNDPRVTQVVTTLDNGLSSRVVNGYDPDLPYNSLTDTYEYGYDSALMRHTQTAFIKTLNGADCTGVNAQNGSALFIRNLPDQISIYNGAGTERARIKFEYDGYSSVDNYHTQIQTYPRPGVNELPISGLDASFNSQTSNLNRGNATAVTRYLFNNTGGVTGSITSYMQYDVAGNVVKIIDPRSTSTNIIATTIDFSDRFGAPDAEARANSGPTELSAANQSSYTFPTLVTNALGQTAYGQFDYYLGRAVDAEDANGIVSSSYFNDALDRPTQIIRASNDNSNPSAKSQTTFAYDDLTRKVTVTSDQNSFNDPNPLKSEVFYDGLGRAIESHQYETATNYIAVQTVYDAMGRTLKTSNPFRPLAPYNETAVWTMREFDALGRVTSVKTPDNALVKSSYDGDRVLVADQNSTDQARRKRISKTDALGRLTDVWEITGADDATEAVLFSGWSSVATGYHTSYSYDTLDNLTQATQGSQTRTFVYDSLKRLISATNPESGTVGYQYDEIGSLTQKIDPRTLPNSQTHIITAFEYDALNRLKTRTYNDGTPGVTYSYDTVAQNGKGRLASISSSVSTYSYSGYDALGRPLGATQTISSQSYGSQSYSMTNTYDLAGHLKTMTYPSGNSVAYNYDNAGRLGDKDAENLAFKGNLGEGGALRNYSMGIIYSPFGGMTKEQLGTTLAIFNKRFYNVRGQLAEIRESTSYTGPTDTTWNRGAIINDYSDTCSGVCTNQNMTDNNGNLKKQQHWIPDTDGNLSANFVQQYDYDSLNRLSRVADNLSNPTWRQEYHYDRFGNRTITVDTTGLTPHSYAVSDLTNKLYGPGETDQNHSLIDYDLAGNQQKDYYTDNPTGHHYDRTYDAENRMKSSTDGAAMSTYTYDGNGFRVKRLIGASETWQVYGISGELMAEYAAGADHATPQKEYGYRNGELLIIASAGTAGWGAPPSYTGPNPLSTGDLITLENLTELRTAVNQLRQHAGLPAYNFTVDPNPVRGETSVKADHIRQLRTALEQARSALGLSTGGYAHQTLTENQSLIYAIDFQEIRTQIASAWQSGSGGVDIRWLVTDQLGTPRMIFDQSGSLTMTDQNGNCVSGVIRHDYLPFGEELFGGPPSAPGPGGRTTAQGYSASDNVREKFTQKERDTETGLDYFEARYYSSLQGRFTSVDPYNITREVQITARRDPEKAKAQLDSYLGFPQQWNRYGYGANNPLKYVDPSGELIELTGSTQEERDAALNELRWLVGKEAGKHLGMRQEKGKDGKIHYYVTSDANLCDVGSLSPKLGYYLSEMIDRKDHVTELQFADSVTTKYATYTTISQGGAVTVGAEESLTGNTQIFLHKQSSAYAEAQFNTPFHRRGFSPGTGWVWAEDDVVLAHELGHAYANAIEHKAIHSSRDTYDRANEFENWQRESSRYADQTVYKKFTRTYHY